MDPLGYPRMIRNVIAALLSRPQEAGLRWQADGPGSFRCVISVSPNDVGRILGGKGHTISALRSVIKAAAQHHGHRVSIRIETNEPTPRRIH